MDIDWRRVGAYVVCRDESDRLLLTRFYSESHRDSGKWTMPGGGMEWGENPTQTALRELFEETGLTASIGPVLGFYSQWFTAAQAAYGTAGHHLGIVFRAVDLTGDLQTEFADGTTDAAQWFSLSEVEVLPRTPLLDYGLELIQSVGE